MTTKYAQFIKAIRIKRGFSQSFVAEKIGISRSSYITVEQGSRDLSLREAEKIAEIFGMSIEEFSNATIPHYEKYKQMILAFLHSSISTDGKVPKTKLAKLLYLADFAWYYKHLESMSGMQYIRRTYGPVPDPYFRALAELEEEGKIAVNHKGDALLVSLSRSSEKQKKDLLKNGEFELIKKIGTKWKGKNTRDIVNFTHQQLPYKLCASDEAIPYGLIIQEDPDYVY